MQVIPAIDLKDGRCVRLLRGDLAAETVYGEDPVAMGRRWVEEGAEILHVVDLQGAVDGRPVNGDAIAALCRELTIPVQVGGGVRSVARAAELLDAGAARVIFGTAALQEPQVVREASTQFPGRVAVGIDVRDGRVAVRGWTEVGDLDAITMARRAEDLGASWVIYTDISRDGTQTGVNVAATRAVAEAIRIPVIASGGVGSLDDIEALLPHRSAGIQGVIVGRALYTGAVDLRQALRLTADNPPA